MVLLRFNQERTAMRLMKIAAIALAAQFASGIALAQSDKSKTESGHHYQGGPKTEVPHHMQDMKGQTTGSAKKSKESHSYQGGPKSDAPHKMGK
jgi:hypothetical protein